MTFCRWLCIPCILLGAVISGSPPVWAADDNRLEMWEEPSHQLVFVEGPVRILDVRIVPGVTSDFHKHRFATLYIIIQDALVANQFWEKVWSASGPRQYRDPGATVDNAGYVANPYYHRVRNEDERTFHVVAIINERVQTDTKSGEDGINKVIENPWFRESRVRVAPGRKSESMKFSNDVVLVQFAAGTSHVLEGGIAHGYKGAPGGFSWHPAGSSFSIANTSGTEMEFVLIEVKD